MAALPLFPEMVSNSRAAAWTPPAGTGRLAACAALRDAGLPPAVLAVLEASGCDDAAAVRALSGAELERVGVPARHQETLARALAANDAALAAAAGAAEAAGREEWGVVPPPPRAARRLAAKHAAAAAAQQQPGFVFLTNRQTRPELLRRRLFGLPKGQLKDMAKITAATPLFLYDFDAKTIAGPAKAAGAAGLDLEPGAWRGRFPAQLRFVAPGAAPDDLPCVRVAGARYKSGPLDRERTAELLARLRAAA